MKFLSQMMPLCFHVMRTHHAAEEESPLEPVKLIKPDGHVSLYRQPVYASELMSEFPKHLVCHSDSFYIGQKVQALSEHDQLQLGQKYFLLPSQFFQSVLSFVAIASFVSSQPPEAPISSVVKKAAAQNPLFDVQKAPSGRLRIRISDEFISRLMEEGDRTAAAGPDDDACGSSGDRLCTTAQLERDYQNLVAGSRVRQWKPKLEGIKERSEKKKKRLISRSSFGIKRRKKTQAQHLRSDHNNPPSKKPSPSPKPRTRTRWKK
ncbi:hypothetical protein SAY87_001762 [Trapa incisa]|uniref:Uncharacterized protein n=2 Tax=Trapa TaxID=22665 RepID=A0AAN7QF00_TRANT|nr:hypothetical protein SAY87_001762 [Trapa incisa]KAK4765469.1 hypothetical protein SAY86_026559 [Trapa natans]